MGKCQTAISDSSIRMSYRILVGDGVDWQSSPTPVAHNFAENPICDLPGSAHVWDFNAAVDPATSTFTVCLEETITVDTATEIHTPEKPDRRPEPLSPSILAPGVMQKPTLTMPQKQPSPRNLLHPNNISGAI